MKNNQNRVLNSLRSWWSQPTQPESTNRACCVEACERSPVLVVAHRGRSETLMCLGHAREWVASDECRAIVRNNNPGDVADVERWTPGAEPLNGFAPRQVELQ
jgi:hypothetical protein